MPKISVDSPERNRSIFDNIFWQRVGQKVRLLRRNTRVSEFFFAFDDVGRDVNEGRGLGIGGFQFPYIGNRLQEIESEGLIQIIRERGGFRISPYGLWYCEQMPITFG
jgi:hypothetical protein